MNDTTKTNPLAPATGSLPRRPGAGWKQISGPVWEHTSGLRVHVLGMAMLPDGSRMTWEWRDEYAALRQQAYNTKRALMVWALSLLSPNAPHELPPTKEREPRSGTEGAIGG